VHPAHIPERFGLLVIIVLGEAVIAVVLGTATESWTAASSAAAFGGFVAAASIWWLYFGFLDASAAVTRNVLAGMTFVYSHYFVWVSSPRAGSGSRGTGCTRWGCPEFSWGVWGDPARRRGGQRGPTAQVRFRQALLIAELGGNELELELAPLAQDPHRDAGADLLDHHQALDVVHVCHGMAIQLDDHVLRPQARCCRGGSLDDLNDFDAGLAPELSREARGQRPGSAREAEVGAAKAALRHQRADDLAGRLVDGHRQPEPDARDCGVDADHAAGAVREGAARVAGVERGIGLDHVVDDAPALGRQRPAE